MRRGRRRLRPRARGPGGPAADRRPGLGTVRVEELLATAPGPEVDASYAGLSGDSVAKLLFTSGSTGRPKGVLTTHRMLAANQQMIAQAQPFLADERPVILDWLPWSHTFGGSHVDGAAPSRRPAG